MLEKIPIKTMIYEFKFVNEDDGCVCISLVDEPAVETDFIKMKKRELFFNEAKKVVTGCALRADFEIPREGYSIIFRAPEIERLMWNTMARGFATTLHHNNEDIAGMYLVESFILHQPDDRFPDVQAGSWMVSFKVDDDETWRRITSGEVNGFSVEVDVRLEDAYAKTSEPEAPPVDIPFIF